MNNLNLHDVKKIELGKIRALTSKTFYRIITIKGRKGNIEICLFGDTKENLTF